MTRSLLLMLVSCGAITVQARVIRAALRHADVPLDKTPLYTGCDVRQFAREIDGDTNNAITRLFKLPDAFKAWLGVALLQEYGVPQELAQVARLPRKRMSKMALPAPTESEKVACSQ